MTQNINQVIIIGELYNFKPINEFLKQYFKGYPIHHFENKMFGKVLCHLSELIVESDEIEITNAFEN